MPPVYTRLTELEIFIRQHGLQLREARQDIQLLSHYLAAIKPASSQGEIRKQHDLNEAIAWPNNAHRIMIRIRDWARDEPPYVQGTIRNICWQLEDIEKFLNEAISYLALDDAGFEAKAKRYDRVIHMTKGDSEGLLVLLDDLIKHDPRPTDADDE